MVNTVFCADTTDVWRRIFIRLGELFCAARESKAGHFTQVVWKGSREIGVGRAFADKGQSVYVVCNYLPAGNYIGHYKENVLPAR